MKFFKSNKERAEKNHVPCGAISIFSFFIYYINIFSNINFTTERYLFFISITTIFFIYLVLKLVRYVPIGINRFGKFEYNGSNINFTRLKTVGYSYLIIGIFAHIVYYSLNPFSSYVESYAQSNGLGFITVFFNFTILGLLIIEYVYVNSSSNRRLMHLNFLFILIYSMLYIFYLMRRRQVLLLFVSLYVIWYDKLTKKQVRFVYLFSFLLFLFFAAFGRARGYFVLNGFNGLLEFFISNVQLDWFLPSQLEGRYITRILSDVVYYVNNFGYYPELIFGVMSIFIPKKIFTFSKPLAFPEWYTFNFHMFDYTRGVGYAGSFIAEQYLIGGVVFLILVMIFFAFLLYRMEYEYIFSIKPRITILYGLFIYDILILPRLDNASLLIDFVFLYIPVILAFYIANEKRRKDVLD